MLKIIKNIIIKFRLSIARKIEIMLFHDIVEYMLVDIKKNKKMLINLYDKLKLNDLIKNPLELVTSKYGFANSTKDLNSQEKQSIFLHFQYKEKFDVALSVVSSYSGGDYFEFGSHDLYTLKNFLVACDVSNLIKKYPKTQFFAFDIFGEFDERKFSKMRQYQYYNKNMGISGKEYFQHFTESGDLINNYRREIGKFNVFPDRVNLIQGFFEETLPKFKEKNKIGFAFIDVNILPSYKYVLDFIFNRIFDGSYIYIDEYFDRNVIRIEVDRYKKKLEKKRKLSLKYVRSAASVGALFRVLKLNTQEII